MQNPFYSAIFNNYAAKLVKEVFERVLKDDSFKLKTGFTSYVLSSATTILSHCESAVFLEFSNQLVSSLQKCIPRPNAKQSISKVQRQNMWSDYHHLISSQEFKEHSSRKWEQSFFTLPVCNHKAHGFTNYATASYSRCEF